MGPTMRWLLDMVSTDKQYEARERRERELPLRAMRMVGNGEASCVGEAERVLRRRSVRWQ